MKTLQYRGFDPAEKVQSGLVEAFDLKEARERLAARGVLVERIEAVSGPGAGRRIFRQRRLTDTHRANLYRESAALLRSGLPLAQALDLLIEAPDLGPARIRLASAVERIREGSSLASALADAAWGISDFERAVIGTGERTGALDAVLERLADYMEAQQRVRERLETAMIYPALVAALAVAVAVLMLGVMIPRVSQLLSEARVAIPPLTRVVVATGRLALPVGLPVLVLSVLFALLLRRRLSASEAARVRADRWLFRTPGLGRAYRALAGMRFSRTLALLLRGGVPLVEGVELAGRATGSPWIRRLTGEEAKAVRHGSSLSDAVCRVPPLAEALPGWIRAGESSGRLEELLEAAGSRFQQRWERILASSMSVLEPLLVVAAGLFVLLIALAILLPVLSLNQTLR